MGAVVFSLNGYYVSLIKGLYHVYCPDVTHAICDSSYESQDLAISRCKYLEQTKSKVKYQKS